MSKMFASLEFLIFSRLFLLTLLTSKSSANQQNQLTQFEQLMSDDGSAACSAVDSTPYKSYTVDRISRCAYDCKSLKRQTSDTIACAGFNYYEYEQNNNTCQLFTVEQRLYFFVNPPCLFFTNVEAVEGNNAPVVCPSSFTYISEVKGCYKSVETNLNWVAAALYCQTLARGGHLLAINSNQEIAVMSMIPVASADCNSDPSSSMKSWWNGLHSCNSASGSTSFCWMFNSTSTLEILTIDNWNSAPQGINNCVSMVLNWSWRWQEVACRTSLCFVCEVDL